MNSISIIIPTLNAERHLKKNLGAIKRAAKNIRILIVDSASTDNTVGVAKDLGVEVLEIKQSTFNHGATREMARKYVNTDFVVMMTQDVYPVNDDFLELLVSPMLSNDKIAVSYARQLPNDNADIFESFPREFNYGPQSQIRGLKDINEYGVYTFFCSNSCAAYRNSALDEIAGFESVLTNEDYFVVAALLQKGLYIAYEAGSRVKHSHRYTLLQEFKRYFDTGYVRAENPIIQKLVGHAEARGVGFVSSLLKKLLMEKPSLIPYAIIQSAVKYVGYIAGYFGHWLPGFLKAKLSMQAYYWKSRYYLDR